jgi:DEAD/DEAH box helicase domain-containing protein
MTIPYERQDVGFGDDRHRTSRAFASKDSRFVAIYDQTYGSLRLTSRMTEPDLLKDVFSDCIKIAKDDPRFQIAPLEIAALEAIRGCLDQPPIFDEYGNQKPLTGPSHERVIIPGSKGINVHNGNNEEFFIEGIFLHPRDGLMYRGRHLSQQSKRYSEASDRASKVTILVPIKYIAEIPGESEIGLYNFETGEIENAEVASGI